MQLPVQGWNCRCTGKNKDLFMDIATEEIRHVEMDATMVARLLEGVPSTAPPSCRSRPGGCAGLAGRILSRHRVRWWRAAQRTIKDFRGNGRYMWPAANCWPTSGPMSTPDGQGRLPKNGVQHDRRQRRAANARSTWPAHHDQNLWLKALRSSAGRRVEPPLEPTACSRRIREHGHSGFWTCPRHARPRRQLGLLPRPWQP